MTMQFLYKGKPVVLESSRAPVRVFKAKEYKGKDGDLVLVYEDGTYLEKLRPYPDPDDKGPYGWAHKGKGTRRLARALIFDITHRKGVANSLAEDLCSNVLEALTSSDRFQMSATWLQKWINSKLARLGYDLEHLPEEEGEE